MPAPQAIQCCLAGGGGIVLHRGTLHAERSGFNLQKTPGGKRGMPGQLRISPVFSGAAHFLPVNGPEFFQLVFPCFRKIMSFFRVLAYLKEERFILFLRKLPAVPRDDGVIHDHIIALPSGVAGQYIYIGNGIFTFRHADPRKIGERGHMVVIGHQAVADLPIGQCAGPGNDEGNADASFMAGPFQSGQDCHGVVWPTRRAAAENIQQFPGAVRRSVAVGPRPRPLSVR